MRNIKEKDNRNKLFNSELLLTIDNLAELYLLTYTFRNDTIERENSYIFNVPHDYTNGICEILNNENNGLYPNNDIIKYSNIIDFYSFYNHNKDWINKFKNCVEEYFINNREYLKVHNNRENDYIIKLDKNFFNEKFKKYINHKDIINKSVELVNASVYFSKKQDINKIKKHIFK